MSARLTLVPSGDLIQAIDRAAEDDASSRAEVLRKALQLCVLAHDASRLGLKIGLVEPQTGQLRTAIVGFWEVALRTAMPTKIAIDWAQGTVSHAKRWIARAARVDDVSPRQGLAGCTAVPTKHPARRGLDSCFAPGGVQIVPLCRCEAVLVHNRGKRTPVPIPRSVSLCR